MDKFALKSFKSPADFLRGALSKTFYRVKNLQRPIWLSRMCWLSWCCLYIHISACGSLFCQLLSEQLWSLSSTSPRRHLSINLIRLYGGQKWFFALRGVWSALPQMLNTLCETCGTSVAIKTLCWCRSPCGAVRGAEVAPSTFSKHSQRFFIGFCSVNPFFKQQISIFSCFQFTLYYRWASKGMIEGFVWLERFV